MTPSNHRLPYSTILRTTATAITTAITCALAITSSPAASTPPTYDTIIRDARIIDGTGAPWFRGDVAITSGTIAATGHLDQNATAPLIIDAHDRYVSPGFIDVHTHCEGDFDKHPEAENFIRMGVTTVVMGNCGGSYLNLADALTSISHIALGPNVATFIGHNTVRRAAMGNAARDPSTTELLEMRRLVAKGMADGALGLSTGLIYTPGTYSHTPEIVALAEEAAKAGGIYVSHMRNEGTKVTEAIKEALTIGREAHIPVHISHFKISSPKRHGESTITLGMVEAARAAGEDVTVDQYAYTASSTSLSTMMPDDAIAGTREEIQARLTDPTTRSLLQRQIVDNYKTSGRPNLDYAKIASFRDDPTVNGMSILEIAKKWKHSDSWEAQADVILDMMTSGGAGMVFHSMDENDVQRIMAYPNTMFASDSSVREFGRGVPHPRGYGNNARVLGLYTRDLKVLRLEDAIRKMTRLPARTMRLTDRGILRPGMAADLVVFDLKNVSDPATFKQPHAYATGFDYVLVNGKAIINNGQLTAERGGQVLYGPGKM
jgi:N-acyl-D-amino-acid deacylase